MFSHALLGGFLLFFHRIPCTIQQCYGQMLQFPGLIHDICEQACPADKCSSMQAEVVDARAGNGRVYEVAAWLECLC